MKLTWKSGLVLAALVAVIAFCGTIVVQMAWAQVKGPENFEFAGGGGGKVVFSHEKHLAKGEKCTDCHTKIFKMADMQNGQACGTCHNGQATFSVKDQANCAKCHQKA